jgi:hypothetical protein
MCSPQQVCCFVCFQTFSKQQAQTEQCSVCGDFKCPLCGSCLCDLTLGEQRVALAMMKTYEPLLEENYEFSAHKEIENRVLSSLEK